MPYPSRFRAGRLCAELERSLRQAFDEAYESRYGSHLETIAAEAINWRLTARVPRGVPNVAFGQAATGQPLKGERSAYFAELDGFVKTSVYDRYQLGEGARIVGPALIEERESTIVVGPAAAAEADALGNLLISVETSDTR